MGTTQLVTWISGGDSRPEMRAEWLHDALCLTAGWRDATADQLAEARSACVDFCRAAHTQGKRD